MSSKSRRTVSPALNLFLRVALGLIALGVATGIFIALVATRPKPPQSQRAEMVRAVRILTLQPIEVTRRWEGFGTARATQTADISSEITGTVLLRPEAVEPGFPIRKGDLIVALDSAEFEARKERALQSIAAIEAELQSVAVDERITESTLALARETVVLLKNELTRLREAVAGSGAAEIELDRLRRETIRAEREAEGIQQLFDQIPARRAMIESRSGVERAQLVLAQIDIDRSRITAPFDGILQDVLVKRGERVAPGTPVARVVNLLRMETPVQIPASALEYVAPGCRATLTTSGQLARTWEGVVSRVAPEADAQTRSATVYVETEQDPGDAQSNLLTPGRFVTARISSLRTISALAAPRSAINGDRVLIVDAEGRAESRQIQVVFHVDALFPSLHTDERQWAIIESGLVAGDQLIISNLDELRPGMMIRRSTRAEPPTASAGPSVQSEAAR